MTIRPQELNYELTEFPATPIIRYMQVFHNEGGTQVPIQPSGGAMSTFYCVQHSMYFNKSYLQFTFTPPAPTGTLRNWLSGEGVPYIRQIRVFLKGSGRELCNIQNFNKYMNLVSRRKTAIDDVKTRDKVYANSATVPSGQFEVLSCNNNITGTPAVIRPDGTNITSVIDEPIYLISATGADSEQIPVINCVIPFGDIQDSILSYDKLFVTGGDDVVFEIYWGGFNQIGWSATNAVAPQTGAVANNGINGFISNMRLMVATETNPEILSWATNEYNTRGFRYKFRSVTQTKSAGSQGTQQNVEVRLTAGAGTRLVKVHWGCYNNTEATNTFYDHDNRNGKKVQQYQTYLNDQLIPNGWYVISNAAGTAYTNCDDYNKDKARLRGSCILSRDEYYYNWCPTIDFTLERPQDLLPIVGGVPEDNIQEGIKLNPFETKVTFMAQTANSAFQHYLFYITERELHIAPNGVVLM